MAVESIDNRRFTSAPTATEDRPMHEMMKGKKGKKMPMPSALVIMFGKPGESRDRKMAYKNKKRKKDYEDEEEDEDEE